MKDQIYYLALIAVIDRRLDELQEDFGELPDQVQRARQAVQHHEALVNETRGIMEEIRSFRAQAHITIQELRDREQRLSEQQFRVRNNREFDALTREIQNVRSERERIEQELRNSVVKLENLESILQRQEEELERVRQELAELEHALELLSSHQSDEVLQLHQWRQRLVQKVRSELLEEYERVRSFHRDALVPVRRESCSGCYSRITPQRLVEIRMYRERIFRCENCGRILYPEGSLPELEETEALS
ncbi:MAG: C4-type zinc ribbon domain-containing protein [Chlorobiota bacterium]